MLVTLPAAGAVAGRACGALAVPAEMALGKGPGNPSQGLDPTYEPLVGLYGLLQFRVGGRLAAGRAGIVPAGRSGLPGRARSRGNWARAVRVAGPGGEVAEGCVGEVAGADGLEQ